MNVAKAASMLMGIGFLLLVFAVSLFGRNFAVDGGAWNADTFLIGGALAVIVGQILYLTQIKYLSRKPR